MNIIHSTTQRTVTAQQPRIPALINNLNEQAAGRKIVSVIFLSLGCAARKSLKDKFPEMRLATITLTVLKNNCDQAFVIRETERWKYTNFFARKQKQNEIIRQFWHTLTGMAAKCAFGEKVSSWIHSFKT